MKLTTYKTVECTLPLPRTKNPDRLLPREQIVYQSMIPAKCYTLRDLSKKTNLDLTSVSECLRRLSYNGLIQAYERRTLRMHEKCCYVFVRGD
jgi:DNA-binding MarR family transcriptional regulator